MEHPHGMGTRGAYGSYALQALTSATNRILKSLPFQSMIGSWKLYQTSFRPPQSRDSVSGTRTFGEVSTAQKRTSRSATPDGTKLGGLSPPVLHMHKRAEGDGWRIDVGEKQIQQWSFIVRKARQWRRLEHWLGTEMKAYQDRIKILSEENQQRKARLQDIRSERRNPDNSDLEETTSQYELQTEAEEIARALDKSEQKCDDLRGKENLVKETIMQERCEQNLRWNDGMRDLETQLDEHGLLKPNFDEYMEARNRLPAVLSGWAEWEEGLLQKYRHGEIINQRYPPASSDKSAQTRIPHFLPQLAGLYNEAKREYDRAKYEWNHKLETYRYRRSRYENLVAQGLDAPTQSEFDREWLRENGRLTREFIKAAEQFRLARIDFRGTCRGSIMEGESLLVLPSEEDDGWEEHLINREARQQKVNKWREKVPQDPKLLAKKSSPLTSPSSRYSVRSIPAGLAISAIEADTYNQARGRQLDQLEREALIKRVQWDSRIAGNKRGSDASSDASLAKRRRTGEPDDDDTAIGSK